MTDAIVMHELAEKLGGNTEATGTLLAILDANARSSEWVSNTVNAGLERDRDYWCQRALWAESRLDRVQTNLDRIIGY